MDEHHHSQQHNHSGHKLPAYSALPQIENPLQEYLGEKAPQIPEHWRQQIAKYGPWITLVILVLTLPAILALFGIGMGALSVASAVGANIRFGVLDWVMWLGTLASLVLEGAALPGLFARRKKGWVLIFYAALIMTAINILSIDIGGLLGSVLSLYIIFQIKNQYK